MGSTGLKSTLIFVDFQIQIKNCFFCNFTINIHDKHFKDWSPGGIICFKYNHYALHNIDLSGTTG